MFRSFFPSPVNFFVSAVAWTAVCMAIWFTPANVALQNLISLGPWLGIAPTEANPEAAPLRMKPGRSVSFRHMFEVN